MAALKAGCVQVRCVCVGATLYLPDFCFCLPSNCQKDHHRNRVLACSLDRKELRGKRDTVHRLRKTCWWCKKYFKMITLNQTHIERECHCQKQIAMPGPCVCEDEGLLLLAPKNALRTIQLTVRCVILMLPVRVRVRKSPTNSWTFGLVKRAYV